MPPLFEQPIATLAPPRCTSLYRELTTKKSECTGRPLAVATHRAYLADAHSFCRWAVKVGRLQKNPVEGVEPIGRPRTGKAQLRIDEARRWKQKAHVLVRIHKPSAEAATKRTR